MEHAHGNPGPGGWGAILMFNDIKKEISGGKKDTTNNIMEITAVLKAIKLLKEKYNINTAQDKAIILAEEKLKKQLKNDDTIISKKVLKKTEKNSKILVEVFFKVKENITDFVSIKNKKIKEKESEIKEE